MSQAAQAAAAAAGAGRGQFADGRGWLDWLQARIAPGWWAGEWDGQRLLFTGDLSSPRSAGSPAAIGKPSRGVVCAGFTTRA